MVRAWRSLDRFDGRSSLRTWLYRIATNVCLDALESRKRQRERLRPSALGPPGSVDDALEAQPREYWIEPVSEQHAVPSDADPAERAVLRQSIRLAFVAALQHLPARQRAALLLTEVLGWSAAEVAGSLDTTTAAVNSALQRARSTLASVNLGDAAADSSPPAGLLERYVQAFERYDLDTLTALLREDAQMSMPPFTLWLQGHAAIRGWFLGRGVCCRGSRLLPVAASGAPAFAQYHPAPDGAGYAPWAILVLGTSGQQVSEMTFFLDTATLFPRFGLPLRLA
jgi:RNA polymerase sigma-70 factor (ECF subfamily)